MISEMSNDEILELLMVSDFNDDYKPEEFKYLLYKWRYFYRILHGKYELEKSENKVKNIQLNEDIFYLKRTINSLTSDSEKKEFIIQNLKKRKLSLKERLYGRIIPNENDK
jgi:hypothetical protein